MKPVKMLSPIWKRAAIWSARNLTRTMSASATAVKQILSRWCPSSGLSKSSLLAKQAIAAVVKGKTKIIPKTWEATYFDWMNNIRDWCISRQLWWGHRIPVWYCENCEKVIVATVDPDKCPDCGGTSLETG